MKKFILSGLAFCALLAVTVFAAGDPANPLASLSYLNGTFSDDLDTAIETRLDAASLSGNSAPSGETNPAVTWTEVLLKQDDQLQSATGDSVLLLAGSGQVVYSYGAVVDATEGAVVPSGANLMPRHRYLVAEDTSASFRITGKTAVAEYQGTCSFQLSETPDYNAMASALKTMGLFRGTFTGYGQGFELESVPTRLQALIMFIRVLGEEEDALAWSGTMPFQDIQRGTQSEKYVGYAYERGYTNGYSATQFRPSDPVNARQYVEFLLRALGYSSAANTNLSDALTRAQNAGVLTSAEAARLQDDSFLRADLVYVSYYGLDARLADGSQTLGQSLMERGIFSLQERDSASAQVPGWRI